MSAYASLLKKVPAMRLYDRVAQMAPKSGFAAKTKKVKDMAARKDAAASKASTAAAKTAKKPKTTAAPKAAMKTEAPVALRQRKSGSARRSLINI